MVSFDSRRTEEEGEGESGRGGESRASSARCGPRRGIKRASLRSLSTRLSYGENKANGRSNFGNPFARDSLAKLRSRTWTALK